MARHSWRVYCDHLTPLSFHSCLLKQVGTVFDIPLNQHDTFLHLPDLILYHPGILPCSGPSMKS